MSFFLETRILFKFLGEFHLTFLKKSQVLIEWLFLLQKLFAQELNNVRKIAKLYHSGLSKAMAGIFGNFEIRDGYSMAIGNCKDMFFQRNESK